MKAIADGRPRGPGAGAPIGPWAGLGVTAAWAAGALLVALWLRSAGATRDGRVRRRGLAGVLPRGRLSPAAG